MQDRERRPRRAVNGIVLLDKPTGRTSNAALQRVKYLFQARKAGHTGSLDPLATGLLPVCLGEATKVSAFLLDADKHYQVTAKSGIQTDTGDSEGKVIRTCDAVTLDRESLEQVLAGFRGEISQIPPMYSALKHKGKRLYALAREGIEIERQARAVTIRDLVLGDVTPTGWTMEVKCSKGTYVRTLVEDIAAAAGTVAHVTALRRTAVGPFVDVKLNTIDELQERAERGLEALDEVLQPIDTAIVQWPAIRLDRDSVWSLQQGRPVTVPASPANGWVRLYRDDSRFFGMGEVQADGRIAPKRLFKSC